MGSEGHFGSQHVPESEPWEEEVRETKGWDLVMICILLPILSFRGSPSWQLTHKGFSFRVSAITFTSMGTSWFMAWGLSFISDCGLGGPLEST